VRENFVALPEIEKEQIFEGVLFNIQKLNFIILNSSKSGLLSREMLEIQLNSKGIIFSETQRLKNLVLQSNDDDIVRLHTQLLSNRELIAQLSYLDEEEVRKTGVPLDSLEKASVEIEKELNRKLSLEEEIVHDYVTLADIQNKLQENEAAVEIVPVQEIDSVRYAALITRKSGDPEIVVIKNGNELNTKYYKYYSNAIKNQVQDKESFNKFWAPVHEKLIGVSKVYLCPAGVYHRINVNTLYDSENQKYVLSYYEVHQLTNTSNLLEFQKQKTNFKEAVFFGRPKFNMEASVIAKKTDQLKDERSLSEESRLSRGALESEWLENLHFEDLPGTEEEVLAIEDELVEHKWKVDLHLGEDALEEKLKLVFQPTVLHIATHGFFREKKNEKSLASQELLRGSSLTEGFRESLDPMLRSGLVLAGVETHGKNAEDGLLTALEASNLNLEGTELVVLSACETGLGEIRNNGEGVYGLQRAFRSAGAKSVLMSLWKVDDEATSILMSNFYKYWIESGDKREAFRKAQLALKEDSKFSDPRYWGAFIMIGQ
jgi:CHAT domain-containing protein